MDADRLVSAIDDPRPGQLRVWKKLKVGTGNVRCPRCQKNMGCAYDDIRPICKDGGSRMCPHCNLHFHRCAAGRFGFGAPLTCQRCRPKPTATERARKRRRKTLAMRFRHFASQANTEPEVRARLKEVMKGALETYYENMDEDELDKDCDEALGEFLPHLTVMKLK